jgi:uncharacterized protein (TIGR03084 family)
MSTRDPDRPGDTGSERAPVAGAKPGTDAAARTVTALRTEGAALDHLVRPLRPEQWSLPTPAPGWSIAHQVGHLCWTDRAALSAMTDEPAFLHLLGRAKSNPTALVDEGAAQAARLDPAELLEQWTQTRERLAGALLAHRSDQPISWFGPPMRSRSMATARLMETWAHGQDVADALGVTHPRSVGLRDIAHLGIATRDYAFAVNGLPAPAEQFRVELAAGDGEVWSWGPREAPQRVSGSAEAFALVVTQRRLAAEVGLVATGQDARRWLTIAQAFAGPAGRGAAPDTSAGPAAASGCGAEL